MLDALGVPKDDASDIAVPSAGIISAWSDQASLLKLYRASGQAVGLSVVRHRFDGSLCRSRAKRRDDHLRARGRVERCQTRRGG
jgi:hypothetical protein